MFNFLLKGLWGKKMDQGVHHQDISSHEYSCMIASSRLRVLRGLSHVNLFLSPSACLCFLRGPPALWVPIFNRIIQGFFLFVACLLCGQNFWYYPSSNFSWRTNWRLFQGRKLTNGNQGNWITRLCMALKQKRPNLNSWELVLLSSEALQRQIRGHKGQIYHLWKTSIGSFATPRFLPLVGSLVVYWLTPESENF